MAHPASRYRDHGRSRGRRYGFSGVRDGTRQGHECPGARGKGGSGDATALPASRHQRAVPKLLSALEVVASEGMLHLGAVNRATGGFYRGTDPVHTSSCIRRARQYDVFVSMLSQA